METGDQARDFILDMCRGMRERAWDERGGMASGPDEETPMKKVYGERWSFMHGVMNGIHAMQEDKSGREWENLMKTFGYGAHGRGLRVGRRLAFYEPGQFDFTEPEEDETEFTFVDSDEDNGQFTFVE